MVFLGLEKPVEYGVQQIFDPTMANMVLQTQQHYNEAARAEYERGLKDFDTFLTKYGDFISPFAKDMERYGEMVGGIQNTINQAYRDGVDLLRSPEGRMLVRQLTNSIDPAEYNRMRANAKVGFEYLDAIEKAKAKNEFNQEFEDYALMNGGPGLFNDFSSAGGKMWNRPAPYVYQDLNQYTGHIFDKMEDSYIGTGADHYDYYGVSREARQQALTQHLSGLLSTPLGQFHYQNSKANLERILGREATPEEAMQAYQNDILTATTEYEHRNRKLNEAWQLQQELATKLATSRGGGRSSGSGTPKEQLAYDPAEGLFYRGLIKSGGTTFYDDVEKAIEDARDNITNRQIKLLRDTGKLKMNSQKSENYILDNLSIEEAPSNFARYAQIQTNPDGTFTIDDDIKRNIFSNSSIVSHMYGFTYKHTDGSTGKSTQTKKYTDRSNLNGKIGYPRKKVTTGFVQNADGTYALRQFWEIEVGHMDQDDKFIVDDVMRYELPTSRESISNVPDYLKWKTKPEDQKRKLITPSLNENPNTIGLKNTGSMQVNQYEHTPSPMGFWGTSNNEAFESQ